MSARRDERQESSYTGARVVFSVALAVILLVGCVMIMYPSLLYKLLPEAKNTVDEVMNDENVQISQEKIGFSAFPLYGSESFYGVENVIRDSSDYIKNGEGEASDIWERIKMIPSNEGFTQALYSFAIIALITIPVYLLLRLLCYDAIFGRLDEGSFVLTLPLRGIASVSCGVSCVCVSWLFYNTVLFDKLLKKIIDRLGSLTSAQLVAVNASNIFMIVILAFAIIGLLKLTLFRGNVAGSVFMSLFRCLVFIIVFAFINVFIADRTTRVLLFGAAFIIAAGMVERIFD